MKLIPKAKPIRIRIVSGGEEHSSIESLRNNYSLGDILRSIKEGGLHKWLERVGEVKAAKLAESLISHQTEFNSREMVKLTALIFNTSANSINDLLKLWQHRYPKSLQNYIKTENISFDNISTVRELFLSLNNENVGITVDEWRNIFMTTLKRMPFRDVLNDYKNFNSLKPMNELAWSEVLGYHADIASDKELYEIARLTFDYPYLRNHAIEWYQKSARSYAPAKDWVNVNIKLIQKKSTLSPEAEELFDAFQNNPAKFSQLSFDSSYTRKLVKFLSRLSKSYSTNSQLVLEEIRGLGNYSRYLFILEQLYYFNSRYAANNPVDLAKCVQGLRQLPYDNRSSYYFRNYSTLDQLITSLESDIPILGVRLLKINYKQAVLFIAGLAKIELENGK